jgi:hypothetical protein
VHFTLQNTSMRPIPAGTAITMVKGETGYQTEALAEIAPEDSFTLPIHFCVPAEEGSYNYKWQMITPEGIKFGPKLTVKFECHENVSVPTEYKECVDMMVDMGFSARKALEMMELAGGDIGLAISMMPK